MMQQSRSQGTTLRSIAGQRNDVGLRTPSGSRWHTKLSGIFSAGQPHQPLFALIKRAFHSMSFRITLRHIGRNSGG